MKNNIKVLREQRKLTQQECADVFNVKLRAWQTYEQGISEPKFEVLCKIADYFNVSLDYLLGRETPPPPPDAMEVLGIEKNVDDDDFMRLYSELPDYAKQIFVDTMAKLAQAGKADTRKKQPKPVEPPKPDIQVSQIRSSGIAIARGGNGFKPAPTKEQIASIIPVPED